MYIPGTFMCLSFHIKKNLGIGKGGMILTDNKEAVDWFKKARYEGRSEKYYKEDNISSLGWNMYMTPPDAADGLWLMSSMSKHNEDTIEDYPDLTKNDLFKEI
jgi:dTDP-4-amino-4,6-dideoxygalactose transaminase